MRRLTSFEAAGASLAATIDTGDRKTGLLIVSGGREIRIGAHRGMAMLAARIAERGYPVFRFDRRGIGDSTGGDGGFLSTADEIASAAACFRQETQVERLVGFGNCDAATALALFHDRAAFDGLILANPWVLDQQGDLPPPAAIRARYAERLRDPRAWLRAVRGQIDIGKVMSALKNLSKRDSQQSSELAGQVANALSHMTCPATILLAERDNTARAFAEAWRSPAFDAVRDAVPIHRCDTASHSFAGDAEDWLYGEVLTILEA